MSKLEIEFAANDFEKVVRKGLNFEMSVSLVIDEINKGKKGEKLSIFIIEESEKRLKKMNNKNKNEKKKEDDNKNHK